MVSGVNLRVQKLEVDSSSDIQIEVSKSHHGLRAANLPAHAKATHAFLAVTAGVLALAVAAILADGRSIVTLKPRDQLPIITSPDVWEAGSPPIKYTLAELLGPTYGVGLVKDQSGQTWTGILNGRTASMMVRNLGLAVIAPAVSIAVMNDALKHPVPFLECDDLQKAGLTAETLGIVAQILSILLIALHALNLAGFLDSKIGKPATSVLWLLMIVGIFCAIMLALGVYNSTWKCHNVIIPSINISEHFDFAFGFYFALLGFLVASLAFYLNICFTDTHDCTRKTKPVNKAVMKTTVGTSVNILLCGIFSIVVLATNGVFDPPVAVDPDYNPCEGRKRNQGGIGDYYFDNTLCFEEKVRQTLEQAGANVTKGFKGLINADSRPPITVPYKDTDLCPVNVHWHAGAEHLSIGEYDANGQCPDDEGAQGDGSNDRRLAGKPRVGHCCHHYNASKPMFTKPYTWKYCDKSMRVGATYEVHWPHSAAGACGTKWQYQEPFYDGVFCRKGIVTVTPLTTYYRVGVQAQVYTVVNDENPMYDLPDMFAGMTVDAARNMGTDMAIYTGSTTGQTRDNEICSRYTPITWQVDRKCHLVSAQSFDMMCKKMKDQKDDMSDDLYAHGSRETVSQTLTANNMQNADHSQ